MLAPVRDDGVDHVVADEVDEDLLQAGGDERAGEAEDDAAVLVAEHALVDGGSPGKVTGAVGHGVHGVDQSDNIVLLDIDVADRMRQELFFRRHNEPRIAGQNGRLGSGYVNCEKPGAGSLQPAAHGRYPLPPPPWGAVASGSFGGVIRVL